MGVGLLQAVELTLTFALGEGGAQIDEAQFSIWLHNGSGETTDPADLQFLAQNAADAWSDNVSTEHWAGNVTLTSGMARCFDLNGHTIGEQVQPPTHQWIGSASMPALPWETSLCVSEYGYQPGTFEADAKRKRGRYYLPPMSSAVLAAGDSGDIDGPTITAIFGDQVTFYGHLGDGSGTSLIVTQAIFSRGAKSGGVLLAPDLYPVSWLSIDAIIDSQRRRRNKQTSGRINHHFT